MSANIFEPELEETFDRDGFRHRGSEIGRRAGTERLGASLYELEPGQANCPYHWHAANEELLLVLSGTLAVRTPRARARPSPATSSPSVAASAAPTS